MLPEVCRALRLHGENAGTMQEKRLRCYVHEIVHEDRHLEGHETEQNSDRPQKEIIQSTQLRQPAGVFLLPESFGMKNGVEFPCFLRLRSLYKCKHMFLPHVVIVSRSGTMRGTCSHEMLTTHLVLGEKVEHAGSWCNKVR